VFVGVGFGLSVAFLLRNLYPVLSATDKQTSKILLILVVGLHAFLAIFIKVLFFAPVHEEKTTPKDGESTRLLMF
jgi:protein YIPF1/2